jgi:hypothetical protein
MDVLNRHARGRRASGLLISLLALCTLSACTREPVIPAPAMQVRRLTEPQYRQAIADVFGSDIEVIGRFEPDLRVDGLIAVGTSAVSVTASGLEQYEAIAREIARQVVSPERRTKLIGCVPDPGTPTCVNAFIKSVGAKLFRRPLSASEVEAATANAVNASKQLGDGYAGIAASLVGLLTAPDFLFRIPITVPAQSDAKSLTLDAWSKATQLSFFLWNAPPDDALMSAAAAGELDDSEGLRRQIDRLIASPRLAEGVRAFFDDFLQLDGLNTLSKDAQIFPAFVGAVTVDAREQTLRTITDHLIARRGDYRDLFTTRRLAMNRVLSPIYEVPAPERGWSFHEFPADDPRGGLLTHVSFLALHSHSGRTSPTLRGKALREILMCETVPTPPANVNFTIVQDVSNSQLKTTRDRLEAHLSDPECVTCHKLTDPIGLALEKFDGLGRFRQTENAVPIDTATRLDDASFDGAAQLGQVLHDDPAVTSCFVRSLFRYATGRNLDRAERPFIDYLEQRFADARHQVPELMRVIAGSDTFYAVARDSSTAPLTAALLNTPRSGETR